MQLGWVDFSPEERSRTLTVLSSLSGPGSVDELGIGIVRDAMANRLFPGTSTLLTKARYFFLVPYLSRILEEGHDNERQDPRALRASFQDLERRCATGLCSTAKSKGRSDEGIIGRVALTNGKWVMRGPGEVYWASLQTLGFMRDNAPDSYYGQFVYLADVRMRDQQNQYMANDKSDNGLSEDRLAFRSMWNLPKGTFASWKENWSNWSSSASIELTHDEASFLRAQIISSCPNTLYAMLLSDKQLRTIALESMYVNDNTSRDSSFHDFLLLGLTRIHELAPSIAHTCALADAFSEFVLGCRIAYNMQLTGLEDAAMKEWKDFERRAADVASHINLDDVGRELGLLNHSGFTAMAAFLNRSASRMTAGDLEGLKEEIRVREAAIKGTRRKIGVKDMGDFAWRGGHRLSYRFDYAMAIIREIDEAGGCDV